jgi:hypothetical protein
MAPQINERNIQVFYDSIKAFFSVDVELIDETKLKKKFEEMFRERLRKMTAKQILESPQQICIYDIVVCNLHLFMGGMKNEILGYLEPLDGSNHTSSSSEAREEVYRNVGHGEFHMLPIQTEIWRKTRQLAFDEHALKWEQSVLNFLSPMVVELYCDEGCCCE